MDSQTSLKTSQMQLVGVATPSTLSLDPPLGTLEKVEQPETHI